MVPFIKMNGAGNDFVIFDARTQKITLSPEQIREIASRSNPVTKGCDQIILMEPSSKADIFMRIYNADSSEVDACGNATRCVADLLEKELGYLPVTIETNANILKGVKKQSHEGVEYILVDMGKPRFSWQEIPLANPIDKSAALVKQRSGFNMEPFFVSMGNPHVVFFSNFEPDNTINLSPKAPNFGKIGHTLEHARDIFPEGVNVSVASLNSAGNSSYVLHALVWERGAGLTKACGTAACAMLAAANKHNPEVRDTIIWFENSKTFVSAALDNKGHIMLGGLIEKEFEGQLDLKNVA